MVFVKFIELIGVLMLVLAFIIMDIGRYIGFALWTGYLERPLGLSRVDVLVLGLGLLTFTSVLLLALFLPRSV
jgi:hypothetical protein